MQDWTFDFLRSQIVGIDSAFDTPFGRRLMVYCDYTASGRCLGFVERYLQTLQRIAEVLDLPVAYFFAEDDALAELIKQYGRAKHGKG